MMIDPPIDELAKRTNGNVYVLSNLIAKRAKEIETVRRVDITEGDEKSISIAAEEVYEGKVVPSEIND